MKKFKIQIFFQETKFQISNSNIKFQIQLIL
jgi:hypothetical protein